MKHRLVIAWFALLLGNVVLAQDPLVEALRNYQEGRLGTARMMIDEAVELPQYSEDPEAWLLRGFVYKDMYKAQPTDEGSDDLREQALQSFIQCLALDRAATYKENAVQAYDYLAKTFYNDAARAIQEQDEEQAQEKFDRYRSAMRQLDPDVDLTHREIEFLNALGTSYTKRFNRDRDQLQWFDRAVDAYETVHRIDSANYGANYNLATLYYNRGVFNIQGISPENDIPTIQDIQQVSKEHFLQALPYMLKAHNMNPSRRETLLGLEGIYYSLQDNERSEEFRMRFEELPPQEDR